MEHISSKRNIVSLSKPTGYNLPKYQYIKLSHHVLKILDYRPRSPKQCF